MSCNVRYQRYEKNIEIHESKQSTVILYPKSGNPFEICKIVQCYLIGTWVEGSSESFTNLLDPGFELFALEEDDKDRFENLISCSKEWVLQRVLNLGLSEKYVATASTPKHTFESWQTLSEICIAITKF